MLDPLKYIIRIFSIAILMHLPHNTFGNQHVSDTIVINGDTAYIHHSPMSQYLYERLFKRIYAGKVNLKYTSLWDEYSATWEIIGDSLFLNRLQFELSFPNDKEYELLKEFGTKPIFADWYTGDLIVSVGSLISPEEIHTYSINMGVIKSFDKSPILIRKEEQIYPLSNLLEDTLLKIITSFITEDEIQKIEPGDTCILLVYYKDYKLNRIEFMREEQGSIESHQHILALARKYMKHVPNVLTVDNSVLPQPIIRLNFYTDELIKIRNNLYDDRRKQLTKTEFIGSFVDSDLKCKFSLELPLEIPNLNLTSLLEFYPNLKDLFLTIKEETQNLSEFIKREPDPYDDQPHLYWRFEVVRSNDNIYRWSWGPIDGTAIFQYGML
ncbi:MAG: hypothetical protein COA49_05970 [Bacteroidetes bacterium]|nr:MAG: hypothetical protein COA49_05970 [Bacteroidota bacterium]